MSIHASNNPFPCGSPAGPGTDLPPIANTYVNVSALFADQANQQEGYLYGIEDATGYGNTTNGRATVSYKGTTNGDETDYNIEWKEGNIKSYKRFTDIIFEEGAYFITDNSLIDTYIKLFEDDSVVTYQLQNKYVVRKKLKENLFLDNVYDENKLIGYIYTDISGGTPVSTPLNTNNKLFVNNSYEPKNFTNVKVGNIIKLLDDIDLEVEGLIKIPYEINISIYSSKLAINNKSIGHEFIYLADSANETVTPYIRLLDGFKEDNSYLINQRLELNFEYINISTPATEPITKEFTTDGSGLIISDQETSHSNIMKNWVQEYINNNLTGTPPTIIGYENTDVSIKIREDEYRVDTMYRNNSDLVCSASTGSFNWFSQNDQNKDIFKVISLGSNTLERLDRTTAEDDFLADLVMVTSRAETDNDGTDPKGSSYGFGVEFNEPTRDADLAANGMTDTQASDNHEQSPATAIVTAKFKWLRNETGAPWGLIREACRATASNANNYNIYRGFGQIDTAAAKTYIENNIDTWTGVNTTELAEYYDAISPYNTAVTLEEKTDKTPMTKGDYVNDKAYISGRMGTAQSNPAAPTVAKFDEFWSDSGDITYEAATGKFTFNKAGKYIITFNGLSNSNITRLFLRKNAMTADNLNNSGQTYAPLKYYSLNLISALDIEAGDYIIYYLLTGSLRNQADEKFGEFTINKIA